MQIEIKEFESKETIVGFPMKFQVTSVDDLEVITSKVMKYEGK